MAVKDKTVNVKLRNKNGQVSDFEMTISGEQIIETVKRRMKSLMPTAQIIDIVDHSAEQIDITSQEKKNTK